MIWLAAILGIALICLGGCAVIVACQAAYARGYRRGCDDGFWHRTQEMTGEFRAGQEIDLLAAMERGCERESQ